MRILLAALRCPKGDLAGNTTRHLELLAEARRRGCDLAVLPEMSLTGSVDTRTHPERLVALDDPSVRAVVDATGDRLVAALFGIAERAEPGPWITQVYAARGEILGVQRKRHLGEGEEGFRAHPSTETFPLGGARLASIICAESTVPELWEASHRGGTDLLALSAAPGLLGRRVGDDGWRDGYEWWVSAGLADARRAAARLGAWVVVATQAGSTDDEDFPGLAAVVAPDGEVVAQLPDWRPGTLVVDVPVSVDESTEPDR